MAQHLEIERKFLVKTLPSGWKRRQHSRILQGYLPKCRTDLSIRLRKQNLKHMLTVKAGRGAKRIEEEVELDKRRFEALWPLTLGARIAKIRYKIPQNGALIELDIYQGAHRGLAIAEIEFDSERASKSFKPPTWLGRELTNDRRYTNETLARGEKKRG